jgi:hypothetical protein
MTSFNKRENAYEAQFAHSEELKFREREYAVRLLALWAAHALGKGSQAREKYARDVVALDVESQKPEFVNQMIVADLMPIGITEEEIRRKMDQFLAQAKLSLREVLSRDAGR